MRLVKGCFEGLASDDGGSLQQKINLQCLQQATDYIKGNALPIAGLALAFIGMAVI